jgi:sulfate permease, SulP family
VIAPEWARGYRDWLRPDLIAGVVIWSVVTPQALAYAQIAGLPPEAGLRAAPVAMLGYGLIGTSRQLVVSATTATSAVSAAAVGPLADGDPVRFVALPAALALVTAAVLVAAGLVRLGAIADLVSKPVMTGCLFGGEHRRGEAARPCACSRSGAPGPPPWSSTSPRARSSTFRPPTRSES